MYVFSFSRVELLKGTLHRLFLDLPRFCQPLFPHPLAPNDYRINRRPKSLPKVSDRAIDWERYIENRKSSVRCKVGHTFCINKRQFCFQKTPY